MREFIKHLLVAAILLVLVDILLGFFFFSYYLKKTHPVFNRNEDIILMGSSRMKNMISPKVICDSLHMTCYNLGQPGQNIYYDYAILNLLLEYHTPKMIIVDSFYDDFNKKKGEYDGLEMLNKFHGMNPVVDSIIGLQNKKFEYLLYSNFLKSNTYVLNLLRKKVKEEGSSCNGYIPLSSKSKRIGKEYIFHPIQLRKSKISICNEFIKLCNKKNIALYIVVAPSYREYRDGIESPYKELPSLLKGEYVLLNHELDSTFLNCKKMFWDQHHLCKEASAIYVEKIVKEIKETLSK